MPVRCRVPSFAWCHQYLSSPLAEGGSAEDQDYIHTESSVGKAANRAQASQPCVILRICPSDCSDLWLFAGCTLQPTFRESCDISYTQVLFNTLFGYYRDYKDVSIQALQDVYSSR